MNFYETPVRRLCMVRACGLFVVALSIAAFSFMPDVDAQGRIFCYAFGGLCALMGLFNLRRARRAIPGATVTLIPDRAPVPVQIRYFRRALLLSAVAFPALTILVAYNLHQLESGAADRVTIWAPLVPIYEHFGYWPTVFSTIVLGIFCCAAFRHKLRKLRTPDPSAHA